MQNNINITNLYSEEIETNLIGALLDKPSQIKQISCLNYDDFYNRDNAKIYISLVEYYKQHQKVDHILLAEHLRSKYGDDEGRILGAKCSEYQYKVYAPSNAQEYTKIILSFSLRRKALKRNEDEKQKILNGEYNFSFDWPDPKLIENPLHPVPKFPIELLPEPIRDWIIDASDRMQVPIEYMGVSVVVAFGSLIGTRICVRPKKNDDWRIFPNLWGAIIGNPSTLKTPTLNESLRPIKNLQLIARKEYEDKVKTYNKEKTEYEIQYKALEKAWKESIKNQFTRKKVENRNPDTIKYELEKLVPPKESICRRYCSNDSTTEKIAELLIQNPQGLLMQIDELVGLFASFEKQGRESDRAFYLSAWAGDMSFSVDRIGRGSIVVPHLCLSLIGTIQPAKLIHYINQSTSLTGNDGLIQRLQLMVYPDKLRDCHYSDKKPNQEAYNRVLKIFEKIDDGNFVEEITWKEGIENSASIYFSDEAQLVFKEWIIELRKKILSIEDENENLLLAEHLSKYSSLMPSLALIFHLIEIADGKASLYRYISKENAERACAWCDILEEHTKRIYGLIVSKRQRAAEQLAKKIKGKKLSSGFTLRDIYKKEWKFLNSLNLAELAIEELIDAGWLRSIEIPSSFQQKSVIRYEINPKLWSDQND